MKVLLAINNVGMMINADLSVKNWLTKEYVIKDFIWNLSNCECQCDKSCDVGEYLDYENGKHRKQLVEKLVEECTENIDDVIIAGMALFEHRNDCKSSCTIN